MKRWADSRLPPRGHNENLQTPDDHRRQQLFFFGCGVVVVEGIMSTKGNKSSKTK